MTTQDDKKRKLEAALTTLAMELEMKEGLRFAVSKGKDEIINLLICASKNNDPTIVQYLKTVEGLLTEQQKHSLHQKGVKFSGPQPQDSSPDDDHKGKKKIVYRGQVKWV